MGRGLKESCILVCHYILVMSASAKSPYWLNELTAEGGMYMGYGTSPRFEAYSKITNQHDKEIEAGQAGYG